MQHDALSQRVVTGFGHRPRAAQQGVAAAVTQAVGFGDVVQQGAGAHLRHIDRKALFRRAPGQSRGNMGHQTRMALHIGQHGILAPEGETSFVIRRRRRRRGGGRPQTRKFRQAGQRVVEWFRRAGRGVKTVHPASMPPAEWDGKTPATPPGSFHSPSVGRIILYLY